MQNGTSSLKAIALLGAAWTIAGCGAVYSPLNDTPMPGPPHIKPAFSIDDFEDGDTTNDFGGSNFAACDALGMGSSITVNWFAPGAPFAGGTPGKAAEISGTEGPQVAPWPWASLTMEMANVSTGVNINSLAPLKRLAFSYKAGPTGVGKQMNVNFNDKTILDYSWYVYIFTPTDTNWHQVVIHFPGTGTPTFAQPGWGAPKAWSTCSTNITSLNFVPVSGASGIMSYDISVDDVRFE